MEIERISPESVSPFSRFQDLLRLETVDHGIAQLVVPEVYYVQDTEPCGAFQRIDRLSFALLPHNGVLLQENRTLRM